MKIAIQFILMATQILITNACWVTSQDDGDASRLLLSVDLPPGLGARRLALTSAFFPWDKQGLFHLELYPKYVRISLDLPGQDYEQTSGTWPDPDRGIGLGEDTDGTVEVELAAPAGDGRRLHGLGFIFDARGVTAYEEKITPLLNLAAGTVAEVDLPLIPLKVGVLEITARCETGNQEVWAPVQVALVDERAQVIYPTKSLIEDDQGALKVEIPAVPLGRSYWVRAFLQNRLTQETTYLDVRGDQKTFVVESAGDRKPVLLQVPCRF